MRRDALIGRRASAVLLAAVALAGCGGPGGTSSGAAPSSAAPSSGARFPDVRAVEVRREASGTYAFAVTLSSPYDTPQRYADGWRVRTADGTVHATMTLGHDHAAEQPFTRTQTGVRIPAGVAAVEVQGHDTANGYGGHTVTVRLPDR